MARVLIKETEVMTGKIENAKDVRSGVYFRLAEYDDYVRFVLDEVRRFTVECIYNDAETVYDSAQGEMLLFTSADIERFDEMYMSNR